MRLIALAAVAALALAAPLSGAEAREVKAGALTLSNLAVRASLGTNPNTAAYLTIANAGARPDRLLSASCVCAAKVEAHATMNHGGVAVMHPAGPITIPARGSVKLAPGGTHLMLTGLKAKLAPGAMQQLTLRFERAGEVKAAFSVQTVIGDADSHRAH